VNILVDRLEIKCQVARYLNMVSYPKIGCSYISVDLSFRC